MTEPLPKELQALIDEHETLGSFTWEDAALVDALLSIVATQEEMAGSQYRFSERDATRQSAHSPVSMPL